MKNRIFLFRTIFFLLIAMSIVCIEDGFSYSLTQAENKQSLNSGEIVVDISGCKNKKGELIVCLYNSKDISKVRLAWKTIAIEPGEHKTVSFKNIGFGEYAIFVLHDEGKDGEFTMRWLPYPKPLDGAGYSNNAKPNFGPADYEDAKFKHSQTRTTQKIVMNYG